MSYVQNIEYSVFMGLTIGGLPKNNYDDLLDMQKESDLYRNRFKERLGFRFSLVSGRRFVRSERKYAHKGEGATGHVYIIFDYKRTIFGVPYRKTLEFQLTKPLVNLMIQYTGNPKLGEIVDFVPGEKLIIGNEIYVINKKPRNESSYILEAEAPISNAIKRYVRDFCKKPVYSFPLALCSFVIGLVALKNSLMGFSEYVFAIFHFVSIYLFSSAMKED